MSYKHHKEQLDRSDNRNQNDHHDHHFRRKRHRKKEHHHSYETNSKTDEFLTHPVWGLIIFVGIIWFIFFCTFKMGSYPQAGIEWLMDKAAFNIRELLPVSWINDFLTKGVIMGVGSVLAFLPNILILFFFLSLLSETQYLPRAAVIMDKYMHRIGLHGSSFIPLLMGFGCNVPAIMATRTIERKSDRIITMLMIPYIPCSARIPTFLLFSGIFFPQHQVTVLMSLYFGGILIGILMALLFKKIFFHFSKKDYHIPLFLYQTPSWYKTLLNMWDAAWEYVKKIGTVVLVAVIIVWALDYFPLKKGDVRTTLEPSYLEQFGKSIEPLMAPLGFDWKMSVSLVTGVTAKEFIISTLGVVYQANDTGPGAAATGTPTSLAKRIKEEKVFKKSNALSFMIFALLYMPCVAAAFTIMKESGSWKWALLSIFTTISVAWIAAFLSFRIGTLIWG